MRVLHVINGEDYAGAERVQDHLALRLPEFGYEVGFACLKPQRFAAARQAQHAPVYDLAMRSRGDLKPVAKLARLIRSGGYSLIHTHTPRAALLGRPASLLAGVPMVHHAHSQTATEVGSRVLSRFNAVVEWLSLWRAAGVICVSESICRYLREHGYARRRLWLVPNGVPLAESLPPRTPPAGEWTVGTVALFRPRKGVEVLLEAISRLRSQGLPARLRAVGRFQSPEYEREILIRTEQLGLAGAVDWVGFRQDVAAELAQIDIFVLPSLIAEAMPMSILEAMAAGTPVVGSRVDGVTDLVHDGEHGLLATPGDPQDLARVLARVIRGDADWNVLRLRAHERQVALFSDRSMAAGVADVYERILSP
jgi:glycosyltransferase involved in cell wall biosynthesis